MFLLIFVCFLQLLLPHIVGHFPAGNSFNTIEHYIQIFQSGKFRQYDYGRAKNILIYNSVEPPDYNLTSITLPIALFYGPGDLLDNIMVNNEKIDKKNIDVRNIKNKLT